MKEELFTLKDSTSKILKGNESLKKQKMFFSKNHHPRYFMILLYHQKFHKATKTPARKSGHFFI